MTRGILSLVTRLCSASTFCMFRWELRIAFIHNGEQDVLKAYMYLSDWKSLKGATILEKAPFGLASYENSLQPPPSPTPYSR